MRGRMRLRREVRHGASGSLVPDEYIHRGRLSDSGLDRAHGWDRRARFGEWIGQQKETMTLTLSQTAQPQVFTDMGSYAHVGVGFMAGYLSPGWALAIAAAFIGYQLSQVSAGVPWGRTGGEVIEFALGAAIAALVAKK